MKKELFRYFYTVIFIGLTVAVANQGLLAAPGAGKQRLERTIDPAAAEVFRELKDSVHGDNPASVGPNNLISSANRLSFKIGKHFAVSLYDADCFLTHSICYAYCVAGLAELMDLLADRPEAADLKHIQSSIIRRSDTPDGVRDKLESVADSYRATLTPEQDWYYRVALELVELIVCARSGNVEGVKNSLSETAEMIKIAPANTDAQLIERLAEIISLGGDPGESGADELVTKAGQLVQAVDRI